MIKFLKHRVNDTDDINFNYGIELDVWNYNGYAVLSHDSPKEDCIELGDLLSFRLPYYAINAKSTGLEIIVPELKNRKDYFIFDAAVPEALKLLKAGLNVFTRQSEYEKAPSFYNEANGIWLDQMESDWVSQWDLNVHLSTYNTDKTRKQVAIVSPELHGRDPKAFWLKLKGMDLVGDVWLCTKFPDEAKKVIYGI